MTGIKVTYPTPDDDDESNTSKLHKPIKLFGKDLREIKCFRDSFICGICCGITGGLATFLVTSRTLLSTHLAFASLWIGVFGYWFPCRYKYENSYLLREKLKSRKNTLKSDEQSFKV